MKKGSLEAIMRQMAGRLETVDAPDASLLKKAGDTIDQVEALMPVDPLLAILHKEYVDARKHLNKLVEENGAHDPMAEVAADMVDSARSAVQTRMLELRKFREAETREVLYRRYKAHRAVEEAEANRKYLEQRRKELGNDVSFWVFMMYWTMSKTLRATQARLSAANDFTLAVMRHDQRAYAA